MLYTCENLGITSKFKFKAEITKHVIANLKISELLIDAIL